MRAFTRKKSTPSAHDGHPSNHTLTSSPREIPTYVPDPSHFPTRQSGTLHMEVVAPITNSYETSANLMSGQRMTNKTPTVLRPSPCPAPELLLARTSPVLPSATSNERQSGRNEQLERGAKYVGSSPRRWRGSPRGSAGLTHFMTVRLAAAGFFVRGVAERRMAQASLGTEKPWETARCSRGVDPPRSVELMNTNSWCASRNADEPTYRKTLKSNNRHAAARQLTIRRFQLPLLPVCVSIRLPGHMALISFFGEEQLWCCLWLACNPRL